MNRFGISSILLARAKAVLTGTGAPPTRLRSIMSLRTLTACLVALVAIFASGLTAQSQVVVGTGTTSATSMAPIYRSSAASTFDYSRYYVMYTAGDLTGLPSGASISNLEFYLTSGDTVVGASASLSIYMRNTAATNYTAAQTWDTTGATMVYSNAAQTITAPGGFLTFGAFTSNFIYSGGSIEVLVDWDCSSFVGNPTTAGFSWQYSARTGSSTDSQIAGPGGSSTTPITSLPITSSTNYSRLPNARFTYTIGDSISMTGGTVTGLTAANQTDVLVSGFTASANNNAAQDFNTIVFTYTGTVSTASVTNVKLWDDTNSNGVVDTGEPQLGSTVAALSGSTATFNSAPLFNLAGGTSKNLLITCDVGAANANQTVSFEINSSSGVSASPGPDVTTYPINGGGVSIVVYSSTLPYLENFDGGSLAANVRVTTAGGTFPTASAVGGTISSGARTANALGFISGITIGNTSALSGTSFFHTAYNTGGAAAALDFLFDLSAYNASTQKLELRFWWIDDGMDTTASHLPFDHVFISVDGGATWLTSLYQFDMTGTVATWTEGVVDVSAALTAASSNFTNRVVIRLQAAEDSSLDIFNYEDVSLREVPSSLEVGGRPLPGQSSFAISPSGDIVVLAPTFTAHIVNRVVSDITVTNSGTVSDSDITAVKLWEDTNGNALLDGADTPIGTSQTFTAGSATFSSLVLNVTTGAPVDLLVTYEFAPGATGTIGCSIDSAADVVATPGLVNPQFPQTFPIEETLGNLVASVAALPYSENFDGTISGNVSAATTPGSYPTATAVGGTTGQGVSSNSGLLTVGGTFLGTAPNSGANQAIFNWNNLSQATIALDFHFDLSAYNANNDQIELRFAWNDEGLDSVASMLPFDYVFISIDGGATWLTALFYLDPTLVTSTTTNAYSSEVVDVSQVLRSISSNYTSSVVIRFQVNDDDDTDAMLLDDVELVYVPPTAPTIAAPVATGGQATEVLTGATETTANSSGHPINTFYHDQRMESIYLASELSAAGIVGGSPITEVHLRVAQLPGKDVENFRIRMQQTANATVTTFSTSGFTDVYGPTTLTPAMFTAGAWYVFTLTTPFVWNGTDNLVVDFTTDGASYATGGGIYVRGTGASRSVTGYADSAATAPYPFDNFTNQTARAYVPSIRFKSASIPFLAIGGANPNYTGTVDLGGDLNFRVEAQDVNTIGTLTWTVTDLGTGSLTAAQAGFDQVFTGSVYNDPNPGQASPHSIGLTGIASQLGTVDLELEVSDGTLTTTITMAITIQAGSPLIRARNVGNLDFFTYTAGTPSQFTDTFEVAGFALAANLDVDAPVDFEVSTQATTGFGPSVSLVPGGSGIVPFTTIYVRYSPTTPGPHSDTVTCSSTGAGDLELPVTGQIIPPAIPVLSDPRAPFTGSPILITEIDIGATDKIEIQNVSGSSFDATGWQLILSNSYTDMDIVNGNIQTLGVIGAGQLLYWTDSTTDNYWGSNILWNPGAAPNFTGWAMLVDATGNVMDFAAWNCTAAEIQGMSVTAGGFTGLNPGTGWSGDGFDIPTLDAYERTGNGDTNDMSDWVGVATGSINATNPGLTLPFQGIGAGFIQITGAAPTFTGTCFVSDDLELNFDVDDANILETMTFTVTVTGGSLTAAQAGFNETFTTGVYNDPAPGIAPHALQLTGTAAIAGTISFLIEVSDGMFNVSYNFDLTIQDIPTVTVTNPPQQPFFAPSTGNPSPEQSYTVEGSALLSDITMDAPTEFEISLTSGVGFTNQIVLTPTVGVVAPTTIFVRYRPAGAGPDSGNILHSISIGQAVSVPLDGYVGPQPSLAVTGTPLAIFGTSNFGVPSAEQSFNVTGTGVVADVVVTAPTGFEVSRTSGAGFASSVNLPLVGGVFLPTTVFVRFLPAPASPTTQTGSIQITTLGPAGSTVAVEGRVGSGGTGGGGSGSGDGGGCVGGQGFAPWMMLAGGLAILLIAVRRRRLA